MAIVAYLIERIYEAVISDKPFNSKVNYVITFVTMAVQISGTYGSLVLAAWKDCGQLAESLRRIEARMPISKGTLKKIRISSITAAAVATILVKTIQVSLSQVLHNNLVACLN